MPLPLLSVAVSVRHWLVQEGSGYMWLSSNSHCWGQSGFWLLRSLSFPVAWGPDSRPWNCVWLSPFALTLNHSTLWNLQEPPLRQGFCPAQLGSTCLGHCGLSFESILHELGVASLTNLALPPLPPCPTQVLHPLCPFSFWADSTMWCGGLAVCLTGHFPHASLVFYYWFPWERLSGYVRCSPSCPWILGNSHVLSS